MADLVIRNGLVVHGTGAPAFPGDVAVSDGRIIEVAPPADHTHYDGQATWDPELTPSSWHGVTTTVFGNCSVGFAPVRPGRARSSLAFPD